MNKPEMLLRDVTENPCNMCMPLGGILAFKGIEKTMVIIHGSQGCSTYMRRSMAEHFNEPVDVASSSLSEKETVHGGEGNLKKGLENLMKVYAPDLIGVLTTCLAETIGEDIDRISAEYLKERSLEDYPIVTVPTPGYGGTHTEGYFAALKRIVIKLAQETDKSDLVNVIVPNLSPADIREIKRMLSYFDVNFLLFPDISETLDAPYSRPYRKVPRGGSPLASIRKMAGARATIEMAVMIDDKLSPGRYLRDTFGVPLYRVPIPVGLENTDLFLQALEAITGQMTPETLNLERGRLLDGMIDSHKYNFQARTAVFGEPELVCAISQTCLENGIFPVVVASGSNVSQMEKRLAQSLREYVKEYAVLTETDFTQIREKCGELGVNIAIGHSDGRYLEEREGIPLVRAGFPIHDRVGGQRLLSVGYQGTMAFLDRITNTLLENKHKHYRANIYRKFYRDPKQNNADEPERGVK